MGVTLNNDQVCQCENQNYKLKEGVSFGCFCCQRCSLFFVSRFVFRCCIFYVFSCFPIFCWACPAGQARVYDEAGLRFQVLAISANDAVRLPPAGFDPSRGC